MIKRFTIPLLGGLMLALLAMTLLGGPDPAPAYDSIAEQARLYDLQARQRDDASTATSRKIAGDMWNLLPPLLLASVAGAFVYTLVADRATKRRRLEPDANGFYPLLDPTVIARELAPELAQHIALTMAGGNMQALVERHTAAPVLLGRGQHAEPASLPGPVVEASPELPTAPSWAALMAQGWAPTTHRMLLGYGQAGPVYGGIDALLSTAIAGRPGQGKTTALRFIYAQTILAGGQVVVMDPHGAITDALGEGQALWTASTPAELEDGAGWLQEELGRRGEAWKRGQRTYRPLLVLCDEWPVISMQSKAAVDAAGRVILEARKWGAYALISGQGLPAGKFNGGSLTRDALSSRFIFRTTAAQARMAGLDTEAARLVEGLDVGRCILDGPVEPQIVAVPNTTALDLSSLARTGATSPAEASIAGDQGQGPEASSAGLRTPEGSHQDASPREASRPAQSSQTATPEEARVIDLFLSGADVSTISAEVYGVDSKGGRRYQATSATIQQLLRRHMAGAY